MELVLKEKQALAQFNITYSTNFSYLKPKQLDSLRAVVKNDVVAVLPTGYGKSLIFELLPFYLKFVHGLSCMVVIIMPLNAIIQQEVVKLGDSACHVVPTDELRSDCTYYIGHPEHILSTTTSHALSAMAEKVNIPCVIVDEGHCVLEWGAEFRPEFRLISHIRALFPPSLRMLTCTATASKEGQVAIAHCLGMTDFKILNTVPVLNDNVVLKVLKRIPSTGGNNSVEEAYNYVYKPLILELFHLKENFPLTIVYCKLKWCSYGVELATRLLGTEFIRQADLPSVVQYHSQQPAELNKLITDSLGTANSPVRLVFATIALGMGCVLQHISRVYHAGVPSSLEAYTQEEGRAGRRGLQSEAVLLYNATDLAQRHVPKSLKDYCRGDKCRRKLLSEYFDSTFTSPQLCCDVCLQVEHNTDKFILPSLEERQIFKDAITQYRSLNPSDSCASVLTDHMIMLIGDTYEFLEDTQAFAQTFGIPSIVAQAIISIKAHI